MLIGVTGCSNGKSAGWDAGRPIMTRSYAFTELRFAAPADINISESDEFYPNADVVWRGDPPGDRIAQIGAMFQTAFDRNKPIFTGDQPIVVDIMLIRFHGVTDRTRATIGGVHNIVFMMTVRDARTGDVIEPARRIEVNLNAPGGRQARRMDAAGETQRFRVTEFLTSVFRSELI